MASQTENPNEFDLIVIGSGPGGYVSAIRASQLGMKTACIEKDSTLGGTCLNVGCIPSKALLTSSEKFEEANHTFKDHGIEFGSVKLNLSNMMNHKKNVVNSNTSGIEFLFKKNKITRIAGTASFESANKIKVTDAAGKTSTLTAAKILIATGSEVMPFPGIEIDEKQIISSTGALSLTSVPKNMVVIGGGYIGLEMGTVWQRLGSKVTVVEFLDRILPGMDGEVSKNMQRILAKQGIEFKLKTKVLSAKTTKSGVSLSVESLDTKKTETIETDVVLVSIGRRPNTNGLGLEKIGIRVDNRGRIDVNDRFETNVPGVYAIGDVIAGPMLAHKASDEGVVCIEMMAGQSGHINYDLVPGVVYTWPEAAQIGKTEEQLKEAGIAYNVGKFPFSANGRARAMMATEGFVKILADKRTDRILGAHIIGPEAGTLIHEIAVAMEYGGASEDLMRTIHAHPTLTEAIKEAALAVDNRTIHM
ncbi:MAG: dihydrolipoyl dehydrogenase [Alphaproteobacteria bacterium]|nr:dihydrolipoyl dehydrogenase [Alphaproteobacteria bacterium]MBP9877633.1 dihydrolipoyl dehydrogenase [Alphaproteobacteria bacterium]